MTDTSSGIDTSLLVDPSAFSVDALGVPGGVGYLPWTNQSSGSFVDPGSGAPYNFVNGISPNIDGMAASDAPYLVSGNGSGGTVIGTDAQGRPIYNLYDPSTGAQFSGATPAWPGGIPSNTPERAIQYYQNRGSPAGAWLQNLLGIAAPTPYPSIGTIATAPAPSALSKPVIGSITGAQILLALAAAAAIFLIAKRV